MGERIIWKNLKVSDYIHPGEEEARDALIRSAPFQKAVSILSDVNLKLNQTVVEGTYLRLSSGTAPRVMRILEDVCRILDYREELPDVYVCRRMAQIVQPFYSDKNYLVISDYTLRNFDDDMLYYSFGNAMSMIMAGHVKITTAAAYMGANLWTILPQIKFKQYLHMADATSDRGGLLACQTLSGVAKCHFLELGLPVSRSRRLFATEKGTERYIGQYLRAVNRREAGRNSLNRAAEVWINATYMEGAANLMLEDIYYWYRDGYQKLRARYLK